MDYFIREAERKDVAQMLDLIKELAEFERALQEVEVTESELLESGFGPNPAYKSFVADLGGQVAGMPLVYPRYSTWKGSSLHLEDLIVNQKFRGLGIGTALLDQVVKYGHALGVRRINWEVLDWNEPAITFYENKGAHVLRDWDVVQLNEKAISDYIAKIDS